MPEPAYLRPVDLRHHEFAHFYDESPVWSAPFALRMLERLPMSNGATILDIGCGTGFLAIELAQRCGADSRVYAIDPWPDAMAQLARKLEYFGIRNVQLIERDAAATDLPSACADLIVSNLGINNFSNGDAVLAECFRLAKPGARLLLTTNLAGHMREAYAAYRDVLTAVGLAARLPALAAHEAHRGSVASTRERIAGAGFSAIEVDVSEFHLRFADGSAFLNHWFMRLAFIPGWKGLVEDADAARVFDELERRLNALAREHGELALTVPLAIFEARR